MTSEEDYQRALQRIVAKAAEVPVNVAWSFLRSYIEDIAAIAADVLRKNEGGKS